MATMSRQHYEHLARTLGRAVAVESLDSDSAGAGAAYRVALAVADSLRDSNPRYDGGRFMDSVDRIATDTIAAMTGEPVESNRGAGFYLHNAITQRNASRY